MPHRHVVIAGTGRAGTSFLVRFLGACGLDVGSAHKWSKRARAGMETYLLDADAPYVVKDPWLFSYCNEIDPTVIGIDLLIVPIRELMAAASSRILQERTSLDESEWRNRPLTDVRGVIPGGAIYSLDPVDQGRILAVGFHRLIHWATKHDIPLILLEFPRLVEERDYLVETLWPWLEPYCTKDQAIAAFEETANVSDVRVRDERQMARLDGSIETSGLRDPVSAARIDREAMAAVLDERMKSMQKKMEDLNDRLAETEQALADTQSRLAEKEQALAGTENALRKPGTTSP